MFTFVAFKRLLLSAYLIGYLLYHYLVKGFCYFIGYFTIQLLKHMLYDLRLITLLLLGLMYGQLNLNSKLTHSKQLLAALCIAIHAQYSY